MICIERTTVDASEFVWLNQPEDRACGFTTENRIRSVVLPTAMDWISLIATGLIAFAWVIILYRSQKEGWNRGRTAGWIVVLSGITGGVLLDNYLPTESSLALWQELLPPVIMLVGIGIVWVWKPSEDDHSASRNK